MSIANDIGICYKLCVFVDCKSKSASFIIFFFLTTVDDGLTVFALQNKDGCSDANSKKHSL